MQFHPYAMTFPPLEGQAYEDFKADIAEHGQREAVKYRMVKGEKQGLDGRNRLRACEELGIVCLDEHHETPDDQVETYIDSLNSHRRHLTPAQQAERRKGRVERIAAARAEGKSIRTIADAENVSKTQVQRDLESVENNGPKEIVPGGTISPLERVNRKGGGTYPAKKKPAAATTETPTRNDDEPIAENIDKEEPGAELDQNDDPLPPQAVPAFNQLPTLRSLCKQLDGIHKAVGALALEPVGVHLHTQSIQASIKNARSSLWQGKPAYVCPYCRGKNTECKACKGHGFVTAPVYDQAPPEKRSTKK